MKKFSDLVVSRITHQDNLDFESLQDVDKDVMITDRADHGMIPSALTGLEAFVRTGISFLPRVSQAAKNSQSKEVTCTDFSKLVNSLIYGLKAFNVISRYHNDLAQIPNTPLMKVLQEIRSLILDLMKLRLNKLPKQHYLFNYRDQQDKIIQLKNLRHFHQELSRDKGDHKEDIPLGKLVVRTRYSTFDSIILGCIRMTRAFKTYPVWQELNDEERSLLLLLPFETDSKELKQETISLFVSCSGCYNWSDEKIENALLPFTPLFEMNDRVTHKFKKYLEVLLLFFKHFQSFKWRKHLLFVFIQIIWEASPEVLNELEQMKPFLSKSTGMTDRLLLEHHADFLVEKMMTVLTPIEAASDGNSSTGVMFERGIKFFNKEPDMRTVMARVIAFVCTDHNNGHKVALLKNITVASNQNMSKCILNAFGNMIPILVSKKENWTDLQACFPLLEKLTNQDALGLFRESKLVVSKCLQLYHSKSKMVFRAINTYNRSQHKPFPSDQIYNDDTLRAYLLKNKTEKWMRMMVSDLNKMANNITKEILTEETKGHRVMPYKESILSLRDLLNLLGRDAEGRQMGVAVIFEPIASILSQVVQVSELTLEESMLITDLYAAFVRNLDVKALTEADRLLVICKDLRIVYASCPSQVIQILDSLLVSNEKALKAYLPNLEYLLYNNDDCLTKVCESIKRSISAVDEERSLDERILRRSKAIRDVNDPSVKYLMINVLQMYIELHYFDAMPASGEVRPWVSQVVDNLMRDIKIPDPNVRLAIAKCLGEIGAVDPGIYDTVPMSSSTSEPSKETSLMSWEVVSTNFLDIMLRRLVKKGQGITEANSQNTNFYTIQTLLNVIGEEKLEKILSDWNASDKSFCKELLDAQYSVNEAMVFGEVDPNSRLVFHQKIDCGSWMRKWAKKMIVRMTDGPTKTILKAIAPIFIVDPLICESLLPCIVFNFLRDFVIPLEEKKSIVFEELHSIIKNAVPKVYETGGGNTFETSTYTESRISVTSIVMSHAQHLCSQQIFVIYDAVGKWNAEQKERDKNIDSLYKSISLFDLSYLAFGCESYARALLYLEKHLLEHKDLDMTRVWELLQKIYVALDESDGVDGVFAMRGDDPSLMDQLLAHEANNRLQDASTCCEKGVRWNLKSLEYTKKKIRSLLALDQVATAYHFAKGAVTANPGWRSKITPFLVETTWKLSQWEELNKCLTDCPTDINATNMNMNIGQLLSCIVRRDEQAFKNTLEKVRIKNMNHIAAVVGESDAYHRSYKDLGKLHMISDIEKAAMVFRQIPQSDSDRFKKVVETNIEDTRQFEGDFHQQIEKYLDILFSARNSRVLPSPRSLEPILALQRVLYSLDDKRSTIFRDQSQVSDSMLGRNNDLDMPLFQSWLDSAKIARKSGNLQRCYNCLLEIRNMKSDLTAENDASLIADIVIEHAKYSWSKGDLESRDEAIRHLSRGIQQYFKYDVKSVNTPKKNDKHTRSKSEKEKWADLIEKPFEIKVKFQNNSEDNEAIRQTVSRLKLLQVRFQEEMQTMPSDALVMEYKVAIDMNKKCEKAMFYLARHYDAVALAAKDSPREKIANQTRACQQYFQSLEVGCQYAYESLPRLLHIWCELGYDALHYDDAFKKTAAPKKSALKARNSKESGHEETASPKTEDVSVKAKTCFNEVTTNNIHKLPYFLPSYILYNCFSQLMSRHTHQHCQVVKEIEAIVTKILTDHPDQTLWLLMATYNLNSVPKEYKPKERIEEMVRSANKQNAEVLVKFRDMVVLTEGLTALAYLFKNDKEKKTAFWLSKVPNGLRIKATIINSFKSKILMPHMRFFRVTMPAGGHYSQTSGSTYTAFEKEVHIKSIDDFVDMYNSIAKPKKVALKGTDGKRYFVIAKPIDDMRIDARTQEFFAVVNRLLKKDPESRKRQLFIRRFAVIPFGNNSGLIEHLDNLSDIRKVLQECYVRSTDLSKARSNYAEYVSKAVGVSQSVLKFKESVMPLVKPAVLNSWFMQHFSDASQWHVARNNFIRSNAVMSMVGYIIGLGDRHLENILLDKTTGEVVHVDFSALFNRGEGMAVPEVVPFRLTHNIIDAMGSTRFEGHFRKSCEVTLRVMRSNRDALMSVLYPFVCDPEVGADAPLILRNFKENAPKRNLTTKEAESTELTHTEHSLLRIDNRLRGLVKDGKTEEAGAKSLLPVSVSGQVNVLIEEATDVSRLSRMFIGWASYL